MFVIDSDRQRISSSSSEPLQHLTFCSVLYNVLRSESFLCIRHGQNHCVWSRGHFFAPCPTHSRTEIIDKARSVLYLSLTTHNCYNPLYHYDAAYCTEWCSSLLSVHDGAAAKSTPRCWERANMLPQTHTAWHTIFTRLRVTISHGWALKMNVWVALLWK